jgi:flagellar M-ring protein FliF
MPENRLLLKNADSRPTASVFVDMGGSALAVDAVNSIRSLVANAVEGLRLDDVAVIDNRGNVLSEELKSDPLLGTASSQIKFRKSVEDYLSGKVETMLAKVLGPGKAVVRVSAEIDTAAVTTVDEKYDPESQVARTETLTEDTALTSEHKDAAGATGAGANTPAPNDQTSGSSPLKSTEDNRKSKSQNYEINKTVTNTQKNPGAVKQLTAAVFVAQRLVAKPGDAAPPARTQAELDSLRQMVVNALGIQASTPADLARIVSLQEVAFEAMPIDTTVSPERILSYVETAKPLITVVLAAGIFYFFVRMLRRTKAEEGRFELIEANDQRLLEGQPAVARTGREVISPEMLNDLIRQKPDNVAAALRGWLANKDQKGS